MLCDLVVVVVFVVYGNICRRLSLHYTQTHTQMSGHGRKRKWAARAKERVEEEEERKRTNRHCLPWCQLPLSIQFNSIQFHSSELSRVWFGLLFHFSCQSYCNCVKAFPVYILFIYTLHVRRKKVTLGYK